MTEIILTDIVKKKIYKWSRRLYPGCGESAGPITGKFDLVDGKPVLLITNIFDRTIDSSSVHSEFSYSNDRKIKKEVELHEARPVGTFHTHPYMSVIPSEKDIKTFEKIHNDLGLTTTAYIIFSEDTCSIWKVFKDENIKIKSIGQWQICKPSKHIFRTKRKKKR